MENIKNENQTKCDIAIIGAGPAGMTAGIYSARLGFETAIFEGAVTGGQMALTPHIENYPGVPGPVSGMELAEKMKTQAESFGVKITEKNVITIKNGSDEKTLVLSDGSKITCKAVIIASGAKSRKLNVKGGKEFFGRGISYCAVCDGAFFKDKAVAVIGGGNAAITEAIFLAGTSSKVYIVHRRDELRAEKILAEKAVQNPKITVIWDSVLKEVKGEGLVNSIVVENVKTNETKTIEVNGVFIYVGTVPSNEMLEGTGVKLDETGHILTDESMETNVKGIFAAGDIRGKTKQIATSTADGAVAALNAGKFVKQI